MDPQERLLTEAEVNAIHLRMQKANAQKGGSGWFYWIAGLSLINSATILAGMSWNFLAGLGITQLVDAFALGATKGSDGGLATFIKLVALFMDLMIAGMFLVFGRQARKGNAWAFVAGLVLYALDALLLLLFKEWFGFLFHLWALFGIWGGYQACKWLQAQRSLPPAPAPAGGAVALEDAQP